MKIVYGTDGSECSGVAGRLLAALPLPIETEVTVLSAVRESSWVTGLPLEAELGSAGSIYDRLAEIAVEEAAAARQTAEAAAAPLRERGLRVEVCVRRHRPAAAILEQARAEGADLVVVGSHGKGAMESFLLGSVSERVARYAPCSVLVARGDTVRRVVLGVHGSESAAGAVELLTWLALPTEVALRVVHVLRPREAPPGYPRVGEEKGREAPDRERLAAGRVPAERVAVVQAALERLRAAGRAATGEIRCGTPGAGLLAAATEEGADLLVVGASGHAGPGPLYLGCVSGWVLIHASCSVLLARSASPAGS
jgi:nucleotide-binding universal stress UspA family protein